MRGKNVQNGSPEVRSNKTKDNALFRISIDSVMFPGMSMEGYWVNGRDGNHFKIKSPERPFIKLKAE